MKKNKKVYEGKGKKMYSTDEPEQLIQEFKDDAAALDSAKKGTIKGKGAINTTISSFLFRYLESYHVPTHFLKKLSDTQILVKKLDIIPIEIVVRNGVTAEHAKKYDVDENNDLAQAVVEYYLKDDEREDPMINEEHVVAFGHATDEEIDRIRRFAVKINAVLKSFFMRRQLKLIDFTLEFGRHKDKILLADGVTLDSLSLLDTTSGARFDRATLKKDLTAAAALYQEMCAKIVG